MPHHEEEILHVTREPLEGRAESRNHSWGAERPAPEGRGKKEKRPERSTSKAVGAAKDDIWNIAAPPRESERAQLCEEGEPPSFMAPPGNVTPTTLRATPPGEGSPASETRADPTLGPTERVHSAQHGRQADGRMTIQEHYAERVRSEGTTADGPPGRPAAARPPTTERRRPRARNVVHTAGVSKEARSSSEDTSPKGPTGRRRGGRNEITNEVNTVAPRGRGHRARDCETIRR